MVDYHTLSLALAEYREARVRLTLPSTGEAATYALMARYVGALRQIAEWLDSHPLPVLLASNEPIALEALQVLGMAYVSRTAMTLQGPAVFRQIMETMFPANLVEALAQLKREPLDN